MSDWKEGDTVYHAYVSEERVVINRYTVLCIGTSGLVHLADKKCRRVVAPECLYATKQTAYRALIVQLEEAHSGHVRAAAACAKEVMTLQRRIAAQDRADSRRAKKEAANA